MLGIDLNEKSTVLEILSREKSNVYFGNKLNMLAKYYYIKENITDRLLLKEKIFELLKDKFEGYKRGAWEDSVERAVSSHLKNTKKKQKNTMFGKGEDFYPAKEFIDIEEVKISMNELKSISKLEDKQAEKVAFIMLVYSKIFDINKKGESNWVRTNVTNIFSEAKIGANAIDKRLIINKLYKTKLKENMLVDEETGEYNIEEIPYVSLSQGSGVNSFKINYAECVNEDNPIEITITDFNSVIYYYLIWKGEKWKQCEYIKEIGDVCGKWFKLKANNMKYCSTCAKIEKNKKTNNRVKKFNENI